MPRIHCPAKLQTGESLALPAGAARHVQVLRMQPGQAVTLFDGEGGEYECEIESMGRSDVVVAVGEHRAIEREAAVRVHLALGMPANDRMDWLVEKAVELGAAGIQPLMTERSVLRLSGERAQKKQAHWQSVAVAACEQSGRNRVPTVGAVTTLSQWIASPPDGRKLLLSPGAQDARFPSSVAGPVWVLSGPEGGLSAAEEDMALAQGFARASLGERILRAETAPLAALALLTLAA